MIRKHKCFKCKICLLKGSSIAVVVWRIMLIWCTKQKVLSSANDISNAMSLPNDIFWEDNSQHESQAVNVKETQQDTYQQMTDVINTCQQCGNISKGKRSLYYIMCKECFDRNEVIWQLLANSICYMIILYCAGIRNSNVKDPIVMGKN